MATAQTSLSTDTQLPPADVIRRHVKRVLPVPLEDDELLEIARDAAKKRRVLRQLEKDLDDEKSKRNQQIKELQKEIDTHDRELDTGEQERVVLCDEIFRAGTVYMRRSDSGAEFEPRPATAQEAQRYLPAVESTLHTLPANAPLLDQAAAAQGHRHEVEPDGAPGDESEGVPDGLDDDAEDDGTEEPADETPAQRSAREAEEARASRRNGGGAKGKRGGKGKAK
jgi:hypothetical protein